MSPTEVSRDPSSAVNASSDIQTTQWVKIGPNITK